MALPSHNSGSLLCIPHHPEEDLQSSIGAEPVHGYQSHNSNHCQQMRGWFL